MSAEVLHKARLHGIFFWAFVVVIAFANGTYAAARLEPSGTLALLWRVGLLWSACNWLLADGRACGVHWAWDIGMFTALGWPVLLPIHLWRTRKAKSLLIIAAAIFAWVGTSLIGSIASHAMGRR